MVVMAVMGWRVILVLGAGLVLWSPVSAAVKKPRHLAAEAQSHFGLDMYKVSSRGLSDKLPRTVRGGGGFTRATYISNRTTAIPLS